MRQKTVYNNHNIQFFNYRIRIQYHEEGLKLWK